MMRMQYVFHDDDFEDDGAVHGDEHISMTTCWCLGCFDHEQCCRLGALAVS